MRTPLTASLLRAHTETPASSIPAFNKLFELASEKLSNTLARLNEVPVRVTVEGIVEATISTKQPQLLSMHQQSALGPLETLISCDRPLCFMLCEIGLGGTGTEPGFDSERPLSKIETQLRQQMLHEFAELIPQALTDVFDLKFDAIQNATPFELPNELSCIGGKLLVNAFSYSGEVQLYFDRKQLTSIADKLKLSVPNPNYAKEHTNAMREGLNDMDLFLEVSLPAEPIAFGEIGELCPGQLIRLSATTATPLTVSCDGKQLFSALLAKSKSRIAIRVE